MQRKTKIILSFIAGCFFFPIWGYTIYLAFFDKSDKPLAFRNNYPEGFNARHATRNLALDPDSKQLWCRDNKGVERVFTKDELDGVEITGISGTNPVGIFCWSKNQIVLKTHSYDYPRVTVDINGYSDATHKGGNANREEALKWYDMIGLFFKS